MEKESITSNLTRSEVLCLTADIVSAYVSNNKLDTGDLQMFIHQVFHSLNTAGTDAAGTPLSRPKPAIDIDKSVTDDYIVCLEDGKKLQMLKRHLRTVYNLSVEEYRERWGLPADYPVVAPNYARRRREIALNTGLGITGRRNKLEVVDSSYGVA